LLMQSLRFVKAAIVTRAAFGELLPHGSHSCSDVFM
jgi:hypothetical protein